ncbi:MAG: hypothetical protein NUV46_04645 [Nanoarchaeota archaeon]|nr:hypothetical protein [Nanoarchaeota archaeon]
MSNEFELLYKEDQKSIEKWSKDELTNKEFYRRNKKLRKEIDHLLKIKKKISGKDYFISSIIFHHNYKLLTSKKAVKFAKKSYENGYKQGKWLIASTTDRLLQLEGKPQKFGTQVVNMKDKKLKIYKLNKKTTDKERKEYGLPSLKQLKKEYGIK